MSSRRGLLLSALGLVVSGVLLLIAARMEPSAVSNSGVTETGVETDTATVTGLARTVGWLLFASVAAVFASSGWVRRLVGLVIAVTSLATGVALAVSLVAEPALWAGVGLGACFLALASGGAIAALGSRWPGWAARFDAGGGASSSTPLDQWRALDRGEDPTSGR